MANAANIPYGIVWKNDAVVVLRIIALEEFPFNVQEGCAIVRMYAPQEYFRGRRCGTWVEAKNAESFGRPENLFGRNIPSPTSRMTKPLSFRQISLASPQAIFGELAIVNIRVCSIPLEHISLVVAERTPAKQEPTIFSIEASNPCFVFPGLPGGQV